MTSFARRALAATAAALAILAPTVFSTSAGAVTRETFEVKGLAPITKSFGPIPGQFPLTTAVNWTPSGCANGGPGQTQCDKVPIKIVPPADLAPGDDWWIQFEVSWDDPDGLNDLDVYLWDDQQISKATGGTSYTRLDQSASSSNPEKVKLFAPGYSLYNITVLNWSGVNLGYKIQAQIFKQGFERPFELLAPEFRPPAESSTPSAPASQPFDYSAVPPDNSISTPAPPAFGEIALAPDDDFSDFAASDFERQLTAPPLLDNIDSRITTPRKPKPVPAVVTIFWFGLVPAALIGAGAFLLIRHSRDQLVFA